MARKKTVKTTELNTEYTPLILGADESSDPSVLLTMKDIADMAKSVYPEFATTIGESSMIQDSSLCVPYHKILNSETEMYIVTSGGTSLPMDGADGHLAPITMLSSGTFEYENEQCVAKKDVQITRASRYVYVDCENFSFANDIYIYDVSPSSATIFSKQEITFTNTKRYVIQTNAQEFKFHINVSSTTTQSIAEFNQYTHPTLSTLDSPFGGDFSYVSTGSYVTESSNETQVHGRISVTRASKQIGTFNVSKLINDTTITISGTKNSQAFVMIYSDGNLSVTDNNDSNRLVMPPTQKTVVFNTPLDNPLSYNFALSAVDGYLQDHVYIRIAEQTDTRSAAQDAMYSVSEKFKDAMKDYTWTEALAFSGTISKVGETVFLAARAKKIVPPTNINIQFGVPNDDEDIYDKNDVSIYQKMQVKAKSMNDYFGDSDNPTTISKPWMYKFQYGSNEDDVDDDGHLIFYVKLDDTMFSKIGDKISGISISGRGNKGYTTITPTSPNTDCSLIYNKSFKKNEIIYIRTVAMIKLVVSWTDFTGYTVKFGDYTVTNGWSKYINTEDLNNLVFEVTRGTGSDNHVKITVQGNRSQSTQWTYIEMGQSKLFSIGGVTSYNGGTVTAYFMSKNMTSVTLYAYMPSEKYGFIAKMKNIYEQTSSHYYQEVMTTNYTWNRLESRREYVWTDVQFQHPYFNFYFSEGDTVSYSGETFDSPTTVYRKITMDGETIYTTTDDWRRSDSAYTKDIQYSQEDNVTYVLDARDAFAPADITVSVEPDTEPFSIGIVNSMSYSSNYGTIKNVVAFSKNTPEKDMREANFNLPIMLWKFQKADSSKLAHYLRIRLKVGNYTYTLTSGDDVDPGTDYQVIDDNGLWISANKIDEIFSSHFKPFAASQNNLWSFKFTVNMITFHILKATLTYDKAGTRPVDYSNMPAIQLDNASSDFSFVALIELVNSELTKDFTFECGYISESGFKKGLSPYTYEDDAQTSKSKTYLLTAPSEQDYKTLKVLSIYSDRQYAIRVIQNTNVDEIIIPFTIQPVILLYFKGSHEQVMPQTGTKKVTFELNHYNNTMNGHLEVDNKLSTSDISLSCIGAFTTDFDVSVTYDEETVAKITVEYIGQESAPEYTLNVNIKEPTLGYTQTAKVSESSFILTGVYFLDYNESYRNGGQEMWEQVETDNDGLYLLPGNSGNQRDSSNVKYLKFIFEGTDGTIMAEPGSIFNVADIQTQETKKTVFLEMLGNSYKNTFYATKSPTQSTRNITSYLRDGETYSMTFKNSQTQKTIYIPYKFKNVTRLEFSSGSYNGTAQEFIENGLLFFMQYPTIGGSISPDPDSMTQKEPLIAEENLFFGFSPQGQTSYIIECLADSSPYNIAFDSIIYQTNGWHTMKFMDISVPIGQELIFDLYIIIDNALAKLPITLRQS